jgi:Complex I intermediate-associated protein 30 (CIA30)
MQQNNTSWDIGRFANTLGFFKVIPVLSDLSWFQQWWGDRGVMITQQTSTAHSPQDVWVIGTAKAIHQQVIQKLIQNNRVSVLVDDVATLSELGNSPVKAHVIPVNWTAPSSWPVAAQSDLCAIICCLDDTVAPVSQTAMLDLIQAAAPTLARSHGWSIFDFQAPTSDINAVWGAVDDVVMGGVSASGLRLQQQSAHFAGVVSTANSGGFASIRTRNFNPALDLQRYDGISLRVKGDGNRYKFLLRTETAWDSLAYSAVFDTIADTWIDISLQFSQFVPVFRAKTVPNAPALDITQVCALQLMLSKFEYDGQLNPRFTAGPFDLEIASIRAYQQLNRPSVWVVSSHPYPESLARLDRNNLKYQVIQPEEWQKLP